MTGQVERMLPLYEAKMIHHYDHRWATYEPDGAVRDVTLEEQQDPNFSALPRYWVRESVVRDKLQAKWTEPWLLAWRRIARSTDERTMITTTISQGALGDSLFIMLPTRNPATGPGLMAVLNSFVLDFTLRQKMGGTNASFYLVEQLPVPSPSAMRIRADWTEDATVEQWLADRIAHASSTSGAARAEIDAAMFHLYGIERDDVDYIMDTFPIVRRKDTAAHGEYRTKRLILETYDRMAAAIASEQAYRSPVDSDLGGDQQRSPT